MQKIRKAEVEFVKWRAEDVFAELLTGFEGARYPYRRRATHIRCATHITPTARVKPQVRYAYAVRYTLGRGATHIVTEPKKFVFASDFELKRLRQLASRFLNMAQ